MLENPVAPVTVVDALAVKPQRGCVDRGRFGVSGAGRLAGAAVTDVPMATRARSNLMVRLLP